jgi:hypothetical protein
MKQKDKRLYLILFLLIAAAAFLTSGQRGGNGDLSLEISVDGRVARSLALSDTAPGTSIILRQGGGMNELVISGDSVRMVSADCPGGDCLKMAPLTSERGAIVCLPHKLVLKLRAKDGRKPSNPDDAIDAVTY